MNIAPLDEGFFDWTDGKRKASVKVYYELTVKKIGNAISWYQTKRRSKRRVACVLQFFVIALGAFATMIPSISQMVGPKGSFFSQPANATIVAVIVGTLIMMDKFFGASSAWVRYTMAETSLKELRDELTFAAALDGATWTDGEPSVEQAKQALQTFRDCLQRANQIVRDETNQWRAEFQSTLQKIDETNKLASRDGDAALTVKIEKPAEVVGAWKVSLNGEPEDSVSGDSKTYRRAAGSTPVVVKGTRKLADGTQKTFEFKETVELASGEGKTVLVRFLAEVPAVPPPTPPPTQTSSPQTAPPPPPVGEASLTVKIEKPDQVVFPWKVSLNGEAEESVATESKTYRRLPGPVTVRVTGLQKLPDGSQKEFKFEDRGTLNPGDAKTVLVKMT